MQTAVLGARAKTARTTRGWKLPDMCDVLEELGAGKVDPSTLKRMEDGNRPGDPAIWGKIWIALRLPLRELYEGLGLPLPSELPGGPAGELLALVETMPAATQIVMLSYARHLPTTLAAAGLTKGVDKVPSLLHNKNVRADEEEGLDLRLRDDVREELVRERDRGYPSTRRKRGETDKPSGR